MRRNRFLTLGIVLVLVLILTTVVLAVAGGSDDPLISLSFLTGTYKTELLADAKTQIDTQVTRAESALEDQLDDLTRAAGRQGSGDTITGYDRLPVQAGETVRFDTGSELLLLSGSATVDAGSLTDTTGGYVCAPGAVLEENHLCVGLNGGSIRIDTAAELMLRP